MPTKPKSQSNKLNFWQRLKVAKKHRLATESLMKSQEFSFLQELLGVSNKKPELSKTDKLMGYLHYEAGLSLLQISNDLSINETVTKSLNENLLRKLGVKVPSTAVVSDQ